MNSVLSSNKNSKVQQILTENQVIPFYEREVSYPVIGMQPSVATPTVSITGAPAGKYTTLQSPSAGMLLHSSLRFDYTSAADQAAFTSAVYVAYNNVNTIEFVNKGSSFVTKTGDEMLAQVLTLKDASYQQFNLKNATYLNQATFEPFTSEVGTAAFTTFIDNIESFLTVPEKALMLDKIGPIYIKITFNSTSRAGLSSALTSVATTLYSETYMPDLLTQDKMVVNDWSSQKDLVMTNYYPESYPFIAGGANITSLQTYTFNCPAFVTKTNVLIKRTGTNGAGTYHCPLKQIYTVSLKVGGQDYFLNWPLSRVMARATKFGNCSNAVSIAATGALSYNSGILSIDWSLLTNRTDQSGGIFLGDLRGTTISLTFATIAAADREYTEVLFLHETVNIVRYQPGVNGSGGSLSIVASD